MVGGAFKRWFPAGWLRRLAGKKPEPPKRPAIRGFAPRSFTVGEIRADWPLQDYEIAGNELANRARRAFETQTPPVALVAAGTLLVGAAVRITRGDPEAAGHVLDDAIRDLKRAVPEFCDGYRDRETRNANRNR